MALFNKPITPPTLEDKHNEARAISAAAFSVFEGFQADVLDAASQHDEVEESARDEAARLISLANASRAEADKNRAAADKLRELFG